MTPDPFEHLLEALDNEHLLRAGICTCEDPWLGSAEHLAVVARIEAAISAIPQRAAGRAAELCIAVLEGVEARERFGKK